MLDTIPTMFLRAITSAPLACLALVLCAGIGWCGLTLCTTGALGYWPALLLVGGAYLLLYLASRMVSEVSSLGVVSALGMLAVVAIAVIRLVSYLRGPLLFALVFCLASATFTTWLLILRPRRQQALWAGMGLCDHCGYDLRSSDTRCPECGSPVPEELERRRRLRALRTQPPAVPAPPAPPDE